MSTEKITFLLSLYPKIGDNNITRKPVNSQQSIKRGVGTSAFWGKRMCLLESVEKKNCVMRGTLGLFTFIFVAPYRKENYLKLLVFSFG